jgi:hypothetical protein
MLVLASMVNEVHSTTSDAAYEDSIAEREVASDLDGALAT